MRPPAGLVLSLAACAHPCSSLRNRPAADDSVLEQTPLSQERRARQAGMLRWLSGGVVAAVQRAEPLGAFLFGTAPQAAQALFREDGLAPSCDKEDGAKAAVAMKDWSKILRGIMEETAKEMGSMQKPTSISDAWKVQKLIHGLQKELAHQVPGACKSSPTRAMDALVESKWGDLISCVHQATNVSKTCIRCFPRFFNQLGSECMVNCLTSMHKARGDISIQVLPIAGGEAMKQSADELMGGLPTEEQLLEREKARDKINEKALGALKVMAPCLQCTRKKAYTMMSCLDVDRAWKADLDSVMEELVERLKNGTLAERLSTGRSRAAPAVPL